LDNAATWKELRALIEPVAEGSSSLSKALEKLCASKHLPTAATGAGFMAANPCDR
jgi:hypothetical protein